MHARKRETVTAKKAERSRARHELDQAYSPEEITDFLDKRAGEGPLLVSIPVWGWTGHGKTCALLTATHGASVENNGISFGLVKDKRDLVRLEESIEIYQGLGLATAASATANRMRELYDTFITDSEWPPGTETGTPYLFEVIYSKGTAGYAMFPDLRGGSYQELDDTALVAIDSAHACILVVDAALYQADEPRSSEYRDDLLRLVQRCGKSEIPVLLLLAKSDEYVETPDVLDRVRTKLNQLALGVTNQFKIAQVSVVGEGQANPESTALPPVGERQVTALVDAWVSVTVAALQRDRKALLRIVPRTNLARGVRHERVAGRRLRELRSVRELSDSPGRVCWGMGGGSESRFLFFNEHEGELHEAVIDSDTNEYKFAEPILLDSWDPVEGALGVAVRAESVFVGVREGATSIWVGTRGQGLTRAALPYPMAAWWPVSGDVLVGLDEHGKLHSFLFSGGKWGAVEYIEAFVEPTACMLVRCLEGGGDVVALNGGRVAAIGIEPNGRFAERLDVRISVEFDTKRVELNEKGTVAAVDTAHQLCVGAEKQADPVAGVASSGPGLALASAAPVVAWHDNQNRIRAGVLAANDFAATSQNLSPKITSPITGLSWDPSGSVLTASYADGRWEWFRAFGLVQ